MFGRSGFILEISLPQLQALLGEDVPEGGYLAGVRAEGGGTRLAVKVNGAGPARLEGEPYERRCYDSPPPARK